MKTNLDFELYLYQMELNFDKLKDGMWLIHEERDNIDNILVVHQPPIVLFRVKLMEWTDVAAERREELFRRLLEINSELTHSSFALEGNNVVVNDTLQAENLDFNEFQASIDDLIFAVTRYHPDLTTYRTSHSRPDTDQEASATSGELAP